MKSKLSLLAVGAITVFASHAREKHKNVLFILVDDLKPTISCFGDKTAITPGIDKLASMGIRFDMNYCNQAVSVASRFNLLTGVRSTTSGLYNFGNQFRNVYPNAVTLPQYFKNAGYHSEGTGKVYHIGHGNLDDEASWSVPHHKEKVIEYILPESTNRLLTREEAYFNNANMYIPNLPKNNELPRGAAWEKPDVLDDAYADGRTATDAINRLRSLTKHPEPFFLAVGFARPHLPFCVPKKYWDLYDPSKLPLPEFEKIPAGAPVFAGKKGGEIAQYKEVPERTDVYNEELKRNLIHGYYASVSYMDAQLNRIIEELARLNELDNTIIVFWGDNGWHLGDHAIWTKHTNYEEANKIPLIIVAPGVTKAGTSTRQLTETVDIFPTLVELAGLKKQKIQQPLDGMSLVPVLKNPEARIRDHAYHAFPRKDYLGCAIRTDRYRLVEWKSTKKEGGVSVFELYDYQTDPKETRNIANEKPEIVKELKAILDKHPKPVLPK